MKRDMGPTEVRRLIRPVERQPMREWLIDRLDRNDVPGCEWTDRQKGEFHIKWCHGSRHGWSMKDADLFERWAKHTGRYNENKKDPKKWKANFRCALNSRKDIDEITRRDQLKGSSAFRVYRMKGPVLKGKKKHSREQDDADCDDIKFESNLQKHTVHTDTANHLYHRIQNSLADSTKFRNSLPKFEQILPDFEKLEYGKMHILPRQHSGFCVEIKTPAKLLEQIPGISRQGSLPSTSTSSEPVSIILSTPHTFPLTPEDSTTSQTTDDEDMEFILDVAQEVSQEVTIKTTDTPYDTSPDYVITDISQPTSAEYRVDSVHCDDGLYSKTLTKTSPFCTTSQSFCPLTPPVI